MKRRVTLVNGKLTRSFTTEPPYETFFSSFKTFFSFFPIKLLFKKRQNHLGIKQLEVRMSVSLSSRPRSTTQQTSEPRPHACVQPSEIRAHKCGIHKKSIIHSLKL